jgi:hypothetical protein
MKEKRNGNRKADAIKEMNCVGEHGTKCQYFKLKWEQRHMNDTAETKFQRLGVVNQNSELDSAQLSAPHSSFAAG